MSLKKKLKNNYSLQKIKFNVRTFFCRLSKLCFDLELNRNNFVKFIIKIHEK